MNKYKYLDPFTIQSIIRGLELMKQDTAADYITFESLVSSLDDLLEKTLAAQFEEE